MKTFQLVSVIGCTCVVVALCGFISPSHGQESPSPSDNMKPFSVTDETGFKEGRFRGEVVRIDGTDVVIKTKDGEVRLHRDQTTKTVGQIKQGDVIEVQTNDQAHILSMKPFSQGDANKTNAGKKKQ
ncbi:MAG: hypothetical protein KF693_06360 [Nitrospira sp.]|nr:hypothetical protein [Nitrospira sp.]